MKITRPSCVTDEHLEFLDLLRESGVTNMFAARPYLVRKFSLGGAFVAMILTYWMESFGKEDRGNKMDKLLLAIIEVKLMAQKQILKYPATYHALDVAESIAGWERAAQGDKKMDLLKKIRQIYQEEVDSMKG